MRNDTRARFSAYVGGLVAANGIADAAQKFAVTPSVQQRLETKVQESSEFLGLINIMPVTEMMGAKLGLGVTGPIASRTNTATKARKTSEVGTLDEQKYLCSQTNYDTHIRYNTLDSWAKFPDFAARVSSVRLQRCALDRIMIGFNGVSVAADTDRAANPLLQDVNKGWMQNLREGAPQRVMATGKTAGKVVVGAGASADYASLDGLVYDAAQSLLDPWHSNAGDLVAITGRDLLNDKLFPLVNDPKAPTETLAADIVRSQRRLGGLPVITVPFFPAGAVLVTSLSNLSIYYQEGARRMHVKEAPEWDRIETYESSNDAFVIEDLGKAALVEKIEIAD
ncbi:phage major capsid protein, P2 family [Comamonas testosteroni]|uniref:Phage major capsid protein, P2 family n=1 Tax=Comamonas testosteroni TaxID=285 RepID=A0A373FPS2_COMTE|nr:phage major capsid protein, P2 family [Comamonas testosteroni]RGE46116.1 phage major capsid protein, P2 family [Comamonas testosteroni]